MKYGCARSAWLGADRLFAVPELQTPHEDVRFYVFTPKFTLVPAPFFSGDSAADLLSEVATVASDETVRCVELPRLGAWAVFAEPALSSHRKVLRDTVLRTDGSRGDVLPEQIALLDSLEDIQDYNKVVASYADGRIYLAVAQGRNLLLCNSFEAADFVTAEYFIFMVLSKFQLNPEQTTIYFRTPLSEDEEASLYSYFRSVEMI